MTGSSTSLYCLHCRAIMRHNQVDAHGIEYWLCVACDHTTQLPNNSKFYQLFSETKITMMINTDKPDRLHAYENTRLVISDVSDAQGPLWFDANTLQVFINPERAVYITDRLLTKGIGVALAAIAEHHK